jgi:hypothetical protein
VRDMLYGALSYSPVPSNSHSLLFVSCVVLGCRLEPEICASGNDSG